MSKRPTPLPNFPDELSDPKVPPVPSPADFDSPNPHPQYPTSDPPPGGDMGHSEPERDFSDIEPLSERQLLAIELLMQGYSDVGVAENLRINRKTLWRWKNLDDDFRRALNNARIQNYASAADRYQMLLARATGILSMSMQDTAGDNRFRAATLVLSMAGCFRPLPPKYFETPPDKEEDRWPEPDLPEKVG